MKRFIWGTFACFLGVWTMGCTTVQTQPEWDRLRGEVKNWTGETILWEQEEADRTRIQEAVLTRLKDGLTRQEAVQIALLNNREIQAAFEQIGIAKSDWVQAGLLHNPSLSAFFRFPSGGSGTNTEADVLFPFSDLWQIPWRQKAAEAHLEQVLLEVEKTLLDTVRKTRQAWDSVAFLGLILKDTEALFKKAREIVDEAEKRKAFGFLTDLDVYHHLISEKEAETNLLRVRRNWVQARVHLNRILGLDDLSSGHGVVMDPGEPLPPVPEQTEAVAHALNHRLDMKMADFKVWEAEKKLRLQKRRVFKELGMGASFEREVDGDKTFGPGLDLEIPLFDQNQAQIARASYRLRQARKNRQALEGEIREQVLHDLEEIRMLKEQCRLHEKHIIPLRKKALAYTARWVNAMQMNRLHLLESERELIESKMEHLKARRQLNHAVWNLEYHLGGSY